MSVVWLLSAAVMGGQAGPQRPPMAEEVFKNVQLLKGIPVDQFMGTMGFFAAATGLNCTDCHVDESGGNWAKYADDNALKQTTRRMMRSEWPSTRRAMRTTERMRFFSLRAPEYAPDASKRQKRLSTRHGRDRVMSEPQPRRWSSPSPPQKSTRRRPCLKD